MLYMGVGRIFSSGGQQGIFPKFFQGGTKSGEIFFSHSKLRKQPFFAELFKIQGGHGPHLPPPSDAHDAVHTCWALAWWIRRKNAWCAQTACLSAKSLDVVALIFKLQDHASKRWPIDACACKHKKLILATFHVHVHGLLVKSQIIKFFAKHVKINGSTKTFCGGFANT